MKIQKFLTLFLMVILFSFSAHPESKKVESSFLVAEKALILPGKVGRFDFMEIDKTNDRLLAAHSGGGRLIVVDLKTGQLLAAIDVGEVQGIAIDSKSSTYIVGDAADHKIVFVSAKTLKKTGEILVSGPVDAVAFDEKNGLAYAGEDDGSQLWMIDVKSQKIISTIPVPGVPEYVAYDPSSDKIYQNIKNKDLVAVINPTSSKVEEEWTTLPATSPHGLAVDGKSERVFVAGHNGKLVAIDIKSKKVIASVDIAPGTDQISFDEFDKIIYCASKGHISAVQETADGILPLRDTSSPKGAHTLAVDPQRHEVWISYADKQHSYLQRFKKSKEIPGGR